MARSAAFSTVPRRNSPRRMASTSPAERSAPHSRRINPLLATSRATPAAATASAELRKYPSGAAIPDAPLECGKVEIVQPIISRAERDAERVSGEAYAGERGVLPKTCEAVSPS